MCGGACVGGACVGVHKWGMHVWGVHVWGVHVWGVHVWGVHVCVCVYICKRILSSMLQCDDVGHSLSSTLGRSPPVQGVKQDYSPHSQPLADACVRGIAHPSPGDGGDGSPPPGQL